MDLFKYCWNEYFDYMKIITSFEETKSPLVCGGSNLSSLLTLSRN